MLTWGIIGAGDVCEFKGGPPLYQLPGCELRGVTRRDAAAGAAFAERHGCRYYESAAELLADTTIDAIYVATPPACHAEHVAMAAAARKQVLCEKPMATTAAECADMIANCADAGVALGVAYYRRCYPSVLRAKALIEKPFCMWVNDEFPINHRLDLIQFFCGDIVRIRVERKTLIAESATGAIARTNLSWHESGDAEQFSLDDRIIVTDLKGGRLSVDGKLEEVGPLPATHWGLVANFRDHLAHGEPLACDGEAGRRTNVVLDAIAVLLTSDALRIDIDYQSPLTPPTDIPPGLLA